MGGGLFDCRRNAPQVVGGMDTQNLFVARKAGFPANERTVGVLLPLREGLADCEEAVWRFRMTLWGRVFPEARVFDDADSSGDVHGG